MEGSVLVYHEKSKVMRELAPILKREEVTVHFAEKKQKLYDCLDQDDIQLVIVEMQGGQRELLDELELLSEIRKKSCVSIIVISDEENESTKIITLNAGADDYISTSCSPLEILARIQAQLRRYSQLSNVFRKMDKIYQVGELLVDDRYRIVMVEGRSVNLTPIEYKILKLLVQEKGKVISISQIYEAIWHMKAVGVDNTVAVHICHIREKIESNPKKPQYLKAVWGSGYKVG